MCTGLLLHSFCCTFCSLATCAASSTTHNSFSPFQRRHSLHLCPSFLYLKHSTLTVSCFLIIVSLTLHYITLFVNTSNLFWGTVPLFSSLSLFLQFWARYLNPLQLQHSRSFFPFNFALNEARAHFCLSKSLISELYYCKDMMLRLCKGTEVVLVLASYNYVCWGARSSPSQSPTALLATVLILGLDYYPTDGIPNLNAFLRMQR